MGVPLTTLDEAPILDQTVDGADEVDPQLNLIKGYGRALVREKIVAAASRQLVILVGQEKLVPSLGSRRRLPVEVVPFGLSFVTRRVMDLGLQGTPAQRDGRLFVSDNGNHVLDLEIGPDVDARGLEASLRSIPGVIGTGFFLGMADVVLVGTPGDFLLVEERQRDGGTRGNTSTAQNTCSPVKSGCSPEYP